jgi:hypothetical protein
MQYKLTTATGVHQERPACERRAEVYENSHYPGRFHVRLELYPEHGAESGGSWYGGYRPLAGPNYSELEAVTIGLLWEQFGIMPAECREAEPTWLPTPR